MAVTTLVYLATVEEVSGKVQDEELKKQVVES